MRDGAKPPLSYADLQPGSSRCRINSTERSVSTGNPDPIAHPNLLGEEVVTKAAKPPIRIAFSISTKLRLLEKSPVDHINTTAYP
jgi:hypothetical protein